MLLGNNTLRMAALALIALMCQPFHTQAAEGDAGHGSIEFGLGYYGNGDSGDGNPFVDEELTVIEPVLIFDYNISDDVTVFGTISYDSVSSASIERLSDFPNQSGATGDNYIGVKAGLRKELDATTSISGFGSFSTEYDYTSFGLGGDIRKELPSRGATLKWSINGFQDSVDIIRYNGISEGSDTRTSLSSTFDWYQTISPLTHAEMGATLSVQNGFLETPYNAVVIEDTLVPNPNLVDNAPGREVTEELPDTRTRGAVFGRVRHSLNPQNAVALGSRLYADSWGITSGSLEPRWYHWLSKDKLLLRLRYRAYIQTEADAFDDHFATESTERTQDSDLGGFNSHTVGSMFRYTPDQVNAWEFGMDYVSRSDGLDQILGRIAYKRTF